MNKFIPLSVPNVSGNELRYVTEAIQDGWVSSVGPRGVYDEAKRFAEAITTAYHNYHKLDTRIVRIFNTYGERMRIDDGRAIPAFISQCLRGKDVTVFGDGSQTRSVCYVSDLIYGIYKLMMSDYNLPMNIGNPEEITMLDLAKEIIELTKSKSKIIFNELPIDDPKIRQPDISKARMILNWKPKVNKDFGLTKTFKYYKGIV